MLKPPYPITTQRLTLRPFTPDDLDALHAYESHPDVARHLYWEPRDRDTAREFLDKKITRTTLHDEGDALDAAITLTDTGQLIGNTLLIWTSRPHRQGEIGYVLHPDHHGHGYAAEATREMLRLGFDHLGLHRIVGRLDARNTASARVLQKLGMRKEAHLIDNQHVKGAWATEMIYAMLHPEWTTIHHLALRTDWTHAQHTGEYRISTLGRTLDQEGFIHCSRDLTQLRTVHHTYYRHLPDDHLLILDIDPTGLDIRTENGYPHLYGPLPTTAVTATHPLTTG